MALNRGLQSSRGANGQTFTEVPPFMFTCIFTFALILWMSCAPPSLLPGGGDVCAKRRELEARGPGQLP